MITGAVLGGIGSLLTKGVSIYENYQQAKIDEKRRSDELEIAKINAGKDTQVASYQHDSSFENVSPWINNVRALVRPSITGYALALVTLFYFYASDADRSLIVLNVLDLAAMACAWWFGDKSLSK
jgi:hypothetical protein